MYALKRAFKEVLYVEKNESGTDSKLGKTYRTF